MAWGKKQSGGGRGLALLALIVAVAALALAWTAWRRTGGDLDSLMQDVSEDAGRRAEAAAGTVVHFAAVSDAEIEAYVATGEPLQVAGAFTIDGLGGPFVERVEGDPGTVVGLSLPLLRELLGRLDVRITDLWAARAVTG